MQTKINPAVITETVARLWQRKSATHVLQAWQTTRFPSQAAMPTTYTYDDLANLITFLGVMDRMVDENCTTQVEARLPQLLDNVNTAIQDGQWNYSPYHCGLANGLLQAKAVMMNTDVTFFNSPKDGWLDEKSKEIPIDSPHAAWKVVHPGGVS